MFLYQENRYRLLEGNHPNVGFCTVWNEPNRVYSQIKEHAGIVGTLYSKYGINILLRNLALNPQINKLYIWANGTLSNAEVGKNGHNTLKKIWDKKSSKIEDFELEEGIEDSVINKTTSNVSLIDVSNKSLEEVKIILSKNSKNNTKYMEPVEFKEPAKKEYDQWPSEMVGFVVRGVKIADAWAKTVDKIMRYGEITGTQYGYRQKQLVGFNWVIENEDINNFNFGFLEELPKNVKQTIVAEIKSLEQYSKEVFEKSEKQKDLSYTYGNRIQSYPIDKKLVNQLEIGLIKNLKNSINSRRATITTIVPKEDLESSEPPCLSLIQCLYAHNKLNMLATFRSHDIFKAGISNAYGLMKMQTKICETLNVEKGYLQIISQSAHIYEQDWKDAKQICECLYWEREPQMFWDHNTNSDPRGNFLVSVLNKKIEVTLQSNTGKNIITLTGTNAKYICLKIAQLDLISRLDHSMDIARELQKAEIALQKNLKYTQDQPIIFK